MTRDIHAVAFPFLLVFVILATGFDVAGLNSTSFPVDATHVSTFYRPIHQYNPYWDVFLLLALGSIFGSIHCAGWNLFFPSDAQRILWRVASLSVAFLPLVAIPIGIFVAVVFRICWPCDEETLSDAYGFPIALVVLIYAAARLILLGQAITFLWYLPPSALMAIDWAQFYPHIF